MTKQERDKLRELALAATPGEWRVASDLPAYAIYAESGRRVVQTPNQNNRKQWGPSYDTHGIDRISDAAYISAANPKTVLALLDRIDELEVSAAELEALEPDYWVSVDGVYVDFGMRSPGAEDDGANWCARTEVNQHINDSMGDQLGLRLHLEGLYRHPPSAAIPVALDRNEKKGRDWEFYAGGWNACRDAMLAATGDSHHE